MKKILTAMFLILAFVFSVVAEDMVEILSDIADKIVIFDDSDNSIKKEKPKFAFVALNSDLDNQEIEQHITDALMEAAFSTGKIRIIERAELENILMELNFQSSGIIDESTAKEIGNIAGVDYICYGKLMEVEGEDYYRIQVKVTDVQSGELVSMASQFVEPDDYLIELAGKQEKLNEEKENQKKKIEQVAKKKEQEKRKLEKKEDDYFGLYATMCLNSEEGTGPVFDFVKQNTYWIFGGAFEILGIDLKEESQDTVTVKRVFVDLGYKISYFNLTAGLGYSFNEHKEDNSFIPRLQLTLPFLYKNMKIGYSIEYSLTKKKVQHSLSASYGLVWDSFHESL